MRLLGLTDAEVTDFRNEVRRGDRTRMPGAVRASAGINTTEADISRLISAVAVLSASTGESICMTRSSPTFTMALISLGYKQVDALKAVEMAREKGGAGLETGDLVRQALKILI